MTTQPKALALAEDAKNLAGWLDRRNYAGPAIDVLGYAAELERLQSQLNEAQSEAKMLHDETNAIHAEIKLLEAVNAGLLEALRMIQWSNDSKWQADCAKEAIGKAEQK